MTRVPFAAAARVRRPACTALAPLAVLGVFGVLAAPLAGAGPAPSVPGLRAPLATAHNGRTGVAGGSGLDGVAMPPTGAGLGQLTPEARLMQDKWIGLGLAVSSSLAIGTSFIITKKGLNEAARGGALASDAHAYLASPTWWAGMACMVVGEVANFAAYTFAPPVLVTPLGALSVLIGAVLASFVLHEDLGRLGRVGCTLCLVGTLIIILNAPEDRDISTVDEMLEYATRTPFLTYCAFVAIFAFVMVRRVAPLYGRRTPLVYLSICSSVGSISVMSVKGFGVALKLTLNGNNQFTHLSTYVFAIIVAVCILVQMNYFNKALDQFSTNVVNPIYYVMFTTSTIFASFLLFRGFNTAGAAPAVSLLCGFVVIFTGVYLLNVNRRELELGLDADSDQWRGASAERARPRRSPAGDYAVVTDEEAHRDDEGENWGLHQLAVDCAAPQRMEADRKIFSNDDNEGGLDDGDQRASDDEQPSNDAELAESRMLGHSARPQSGP